MVSHHFGPHVANILVHVAGGVVAMLAGLVAILSRKRGWLHGRAGLVYVWAYAVVVCTALLGVFVFEFRSFLTVATIASANSVFSGYRATRLRGRRPETLDRIVSVVAFLAPALFIAAMHFLKQPWSPVLTWSVLGGLLLVSGYDLLRNLLPLGWLQRTWVQEHLFKMIGAFDALTATAAGTIFPQLQPWASVLPNLIGTALVIGFLMIGPRAWGGSSSNSRDTRRMAGAVPVE